jgi:hypothetical protein
MARSGDDDLVLQTKVPGWRVRGAAHCQRERGVAGRHEPGLREQLGAGGARGSVGRQRWMPEWLNRA